MRKYARKTTRPKRAKHGGSLELRGKVYIARWMVHGKRFAKSTGETDRRKAEAWLRQALASVHATDIKAGSRKLVDTLMEQKAAQLDGAILRAERQAEADIAALPTVPVARLADELRAAIAGAVSERTVATYTNAARRFAAWIAEERPEVIDLNQVDAQVARQYVDHLQSESRPVTCNLAKGNLSHAWHVLAERYRIASNPWCGIRSAKREPEVRRTLTREEIARVAALADGELRTCFIIGCCTGLRLGDAAQLAWGSVDLEAGVITLLPAKTARTRHWIDLPIVPELRAELCATPADKRRGHVMPGLARLYATQSSELCRQYAKLFQQAGIVTKTGDGGDAGGGTQTGKRTRRARNVVGFHSLRHTFVSVAAQAGIPFSTVQAVVGHAAAKMTQHYFHESRDATVYAFRKFPALFVSQAAPALEDAGNVIEAEASVLPAERPTPADLRREALQSAEQALQSAAQAIADEGDAEECRAAAECLERAARELRAKSANAANGAEEAAQA